MSNYKTVHTGYCCCGKRKYSVVDKSTGKTVSHGQLTKREATDLISFIEVLEGK